MDILNTLVNLAGDGGKKCLRETENKCVFSPLVYRPKSSSLFKKLQSFI